MIVWYDFTKYLLFNYLHSVQKLVLKQAKRFLLLAFKAITKTETIYETYIYDAWIVWRKTGFVDGSGTES